MGIAGLIFLALFLNFFNITNRPPEWKASGGEVLLSAYVTGYGWTDNTPPGGAISNGVIHTSAGGTGTFTDPITIAVGHSIINGKDLLDFPKGTKFYIPALRRYFIVEDTCGDGNTPQNGPCHTRYEGHPWLDAWVGGESTTTKAINECESKITEVHATIQDPREDYIVEQSPILGQSCTDLFSDTPIVR